ncbi:hypothetical protein [Sorangium sp. So ce590]|uniref:hypothetical protein n=1 Tax=unclassified Sorangium TaxID=2621164 RepID=UPI003F64387C
MSDLNRTSDKKPKGLLSLLYWMKNNPDINAEFHEDMSATMKSRFGITRDDPRAQLLLKIADVSTKPDEVKPLLEQLLKEHLVEELMSTELQFW